MYLITKWFGTFIVDDNQIIDKVLFPESKEEIKDRIIKIKDNKILKEEEKLSRNYKDILVFEKRLQKLGKYDSKNIKKHIICIESIDYGFELSTLIEIMIDINTKLIDRKLESEDLQIIQMVNTLDDLIHISNLIAERKMSWTEIKIDKIRSKSLDEIKKCIDNEMKYLEDLIEKDMINVAPNTTKIIGPIIGARLISSAGSLGNLASIPASTIQILGAEKALFRFKKEGGKPPKHGVIFQHPYINKSHKTIRGKIARIIALKISLAAKADVFTGNDLSDYLINDLEKKIKKIKEN